LFKNHQAPIGHNLLKPWCDLHDYGRQVGMEFYTLDQVSGPEALDAVIFMDRPIAGDPIVDQYLQSGIRKYLMVLESPLVRPDNYDMPFHGHFDRIFTWDDSLVDGDRYLKFNYVIDPDAVFDPDVVKQRFEAQKLCTMIAGAKSSTHPHELYSHRVRTIHWFESDFPQDFDLYGMGWQADEYPSYRGKVDNKLEVLSRYRFSLCYENAGNYAGYITEKILDCLLAGTVPVYGGAPNIKNWIPADCFIDLRDYGTYNELHDRLTGMSEDEHGRYLDRIHGLIVSEQFYPFTIQCFIETLVSVLTHDVQLTREERHGPRLIQAKMTLALTEGPLVENSRSDEATGQMAAIVLPAEGLSKPAQTKPKLVVISGYGNELPVFGRARALWEFYSSHFPEVDFYFIRDSDDLVSGEAVMDGKDLVIGMRGSPHERHSNEGGYADSGIWGAHENRRQIHRQVAMYDYLLRKYEAPFYLYQSTITSVVDFRAIYSAIEILPAEKCYAGMPGRLTGPDQLTGLTFACGTNNLFSRDVVLELRNRYTPGSPPTYYPNDIWQALTLRDLPRLPLPYSSFVRPRTAETLGDVREQTKAMLAGGHFHFRVKTESEKSGLGKREDIDPWVMVRVMEEVLSNPVNTAQVQALMLDLARCAGAVDMGGMLPGILPVMPEEMFTNPRHFVLSDYEL